MPSTIDTHAILWHLYTPKRLGLAAQSMLAEVDAGNDLAYIPAVVVAEMIMVVERNRLPGITMPQLMSDLAAIQASNNYILTPLSVSLVIASHTLTAIPDIFDRLVAAEAHQLRIPLISRDPIIAASHYVPMIWD